MGRATKVHFRLVQDDEGYPPVAVESVWAQPSAKDGEYVLDNIPFFARDATIGDIVQAREEDGNLWFDKLVRRSQNSLVRVVFFDDVSVARVDEELVKLGCFTEYIKAHKLLAVSIPNAVNLGEVQAYLRGQAGAGTLDYEEPLLRQ